MYMFDETIGATVYQIKAGDSRPLDVRLGDARRALSHTAGALLDQLAKQHMHNTGEESYEKALYIVMCADPKLTQQYRGQP